MAQCREGTFPSLGEKAAGEGFPAARKCLKRGASTQVFRRSFSYKKNGPWG